MQHAKALTLNVICVMLIRIMGGKVCITFRGESVHTAIPEKPLVGIPRSSLVAEQGVYRYKHIFGPTTAMEEQRWNLTSVLLHHYELAVAPRR